MLVLWTLVLLPFGLTAMAMKWETTRAGLVQRWFAGALWLTGIRLQCEGQPEKGGTLMLANHSSYLDVVILGALLPFCFTPKREIARWPVIGFLTNLSRPIYINREDRRSIREAQGAMQQAIEEGRNIVLFPEATTSDGSKVLPFKSGMLSVAEGKPIKVQPVSIAYLKESGKPVTDQETRDHYAWYGDMALVPHLWQLFGIRHSQAGIVFHPPVQADRFESRKQLTAYVEDQVRAGFEEMMASKKK